MVKIGFPRMDSREGYRRDFPPFMLRELAKLPDAQIFVEEGYGEDLCFPPEEYSYTIKDDQDIYQNSDLIVTLTSPSLQHLAMMGEGQAILSMFHFNSHQERNSMLYNKRVQSISLDSILDWKSERMVMDAKTTAHNAVRAGFSALRSKYNHSTNGRVHGPLNVFIFGFGAIGKEAYSASLRMAKDEDYAGLVNTRHNGLVYIEACDSRGYEKRKHFDFIQRLGSPHIVIDGTKRKDLTEHLVDEGYFRLLSEDAVLVDADATEYTGEGTSNVVKGFKGIPTGQPWEFLFEPGHSAWTNPETVPIGYQLDPSYRRTVLSCYAWPAQGEVSDRRRNISHYAMQMMPILKQIIGGDGDVQENWSLPYAIKHATLDEYIKEKGDL